MTRATSSPAPGTAQPATPGVRAAQKHPGVRAAQKQQTRQALLRSALRLMEQQSLSSLSLREVTRAAGIVPAGFYRHFPDVESLGVALVAECLEPMREAMRAVRAGLSDSDQIIQRSIQVLVTQVTAHPDHFRFLARERNGGVAAVRRAIDSQLRRFGEELAGDLVSIGDGGLVRFDRWRPEDLAMFINLVVNHMVLTAATLLDAPSDDPRSRERMLAMAGTQLRLMVTGARHWLDEG